MAQNSSKHWIQGAVKHPGLLTAHAKAAGETTHQYAEAHKGDKGKEGKRSLFALLMQRMNK